MSAPNNFKPKKNLSFKSLRIALSSCFTQLPDSRQQTKISYKMHDAMMSGFACMYLQRPSILAHQRLLEERKHRNNLRTLFNVHHIPQDSQLRTIIDNTDSEHFRPFFNELFYRLQRGKYLEKYQFLPGYYLCSIDGTQYHSSKSINCEHCLTKRYEEDVTTYSHSVLQAAVMHPDSKQVIPLMPEHIRNEDGDVKQDCELNAAKRLLPKLRADHPQLGYIIVADSLFSKAPFINKLKEQRMKYILVAKPGDHKYMMEWLAAYPQLNSYDYVDDKGHKHVYKWMNGVPLNGDYNAPEVNYFYYELQKKSVNGQYKASYKNSWVTDIAVDEENIRNMVKAGRCRWKIENECFNTLKNQGYEIEHNYGHGSKNLSQNFYLLTLLAFTFHQIFELSDKLFKACRVKCGSKKALWEKIRGAFTYFIYDNWEDLLNMVYDPDAYETSYARPPT